MIIVILFLMLSNRTWVAFSSVPGRVFLVYICSIKSICDSNQASDKRFLVQHFFLDVCKTTKSKIASYPLVLWIIETPRCFSDNIWEMIMEKMNRWFFSLWNGLLWRVFLIKSLARTKQILHWKFKEHQTINITKRWQESIRERTLCRTMITLFSKFWVS